MKVERTPEAIRPHLRGPVATIGNFDGLHRGHRAIIDRVLERARSTGGTSLVITFEPHPLAVLAPERAPRTIVTRRQKLALFEAAGIDAVLVLAFDTTLAAVGAADFVAGHLDARLGLREVYVGANFNFGRGREGDADALVRLCGARGITAARVDEVRFLGSPVSSSRIRRALAAGEVELASELLGRSFAIEGTVMHGAGRGAALGIPTANLEVANDLVPRDGVYVTETRLDGRDLPSVTNIGTRPTFGEQALTVETHLLDATPDLYGRPIEIAFLARLRQELRFDSAQALVEQIRRDIERARAFFAERGPAGSAC